MWFFDRSLILIWFDFDLRLCLLQNEILDDFLINFRTQKAPECYHLLAKRNFGRFFDQFSHPKSARTLPFTCKMKFQTIFSSIFAPKKRQNVDIYLQNEISDDFFHQFSHPKKRQNVTIYMQNEILDDFLKILEIHFFLPDSKKFFFDNRNWLRLMILPELSIASIKSIGHRGRKWRHGQTFQKNDLFFIVRILI